MGGQGLDARVHPTAAVGVEIIRGLGPSPPLGELPLVLAAFVIQ